MVPSALAAFSAPNGVNSLPNFAASSEETLAVALVTRQALSSRTNHANLILPVFLILWFSLYVATVLESIREIQRIEVTVCFFVIFRISQWAGPNAE